MRYIILIVFLVPACMQNSLWQNQGMEQVPDNVLFSEAKFIQTDSGLVIVQTISTRCKSIYENSYLIPQEEKTLVSASISPALPKSPEKFLIIHGTVSNNYLYRSKTDTLCNQLALRQHTGCVNLEILLKNKYPFTIFLTNRVSNSSYFSNATDVSVQFRQADMQDDIKKRVRANVGSLLYNKSLQLAAAQIYQRQKDVLLKDPGTFAVAGFRKAAQKYIEVKKLKLNNC